MSQSINLENVENVLFDALDVEILQLNGTTIWEKILEDNSLLISLLNCTIETLTPEMMPEITELGYYAFRGCDILSTAILPDTITSMNSGIFYECTSLTDVHLPSGITGIPAKMFYGCTSLKTLSLPNSVTGIGEDAFARSGLTDITLPENIGTIGNRAFARCSNLTLTILKTDGILSLPYDAGSGNTNEVFYEATLKKIRVPKDLVLSYQGVGDWKNFADIIEGF